MHAVRTPVFGIGFAFVLLLLETLGARAYISDRFDRQAQVEARTEQLVGEYREQSDCTAMQLSDL